MGIEHTSLDLRPRVVVSLCQIDRAFFWGVIFSVVHRPIYIKYNEL